MKNIKILLVVGLIAFAFSCKDNATEPNKDDKEPDVKPTIDLIATNGTNITGYYTDFLTGEQDGEVSFNTQIVNTGDKSIKVLAYMKILQLDTNQYSYFCWGSLADGTGTCYQPTNKDFQSTFTQTVAAGDTTPSGNFINYVMNFNQDVPVIKVRYIVFEEGNEANRDSIDYTVTFQ